MTAPAREGAIRDLLQRLNPHWGLANKLQAFRSTVYDATDPVRVSVYRLIHGSTTPIPPAKNRRRVGSQAIGRFMEAGRNCYEPLAAAIEQHYGRHGNRRIRILDFGCGVGRILQYFARDKVDLFATDVDGSAITYLKRAFPQVQSSVSRFAPPLPYDDGVIDVVYSVSIWTHLSPDLQIPWLLEMKRILSPGGLALLTTIGPHGYRVGTHTWGVSFSLDDLLREGYCYTEYAGRDDSSVGPSYGAGYHTPDFVRREWRKHFDVVDVLEGVMDGLNDLVILRKPS